MKLENIFKSTEGDNWFKRNKDAFNIMKDVPLKLIRMYNLKPGKVIELGCSNGWRLNEIHNQLRGNVKCVGIEAGNDPVKDGKKRYPHIYLKKGVLSDVPVKEEFDLVIVNYVLHWIDRKLLLKSLSEIDRLVKRDSYLLIGDFYPDFPQKRRYHHVKDKVYTWKTLYNNIFISTELYKEVAFISYDHDNKGKFSADTDGSRRGFCTLLRKSIDEYYHEV